MTTTKKPVKPISLEELVPNTDIETNDPAKVSNLEELGDVAKMNTRSILQLQRIRSERSLAGIPYPDVDEAIRIRQMRTATLIRRRQALQLEKAAKEREELQLDQLEPAISSVVDDRKTIVGLLTALHEKVVRSKRTANETGQRRLAAKLRAYEDATINSLHLMNRLANLEQVEMEER